MKKILSILMTTIMACSLIACGTKDISTTTESTTASSQDTTEAVQDTTENNTAGEISENTIGATLLQCFQEQLAADATMGAQALADALIKTQEQYISGMTMPVEPGLLSGFGNTEITGFQEAVMFSPMVGTHPFVGYVFILEEGADVTAFEELLTSNADLRWNICTEADDMIVDHVENKVMFVMCPTSWATP